MELEALGYIECTARVHKEGQFFVSLCDELDVSSFGDSTDEALENLRDAVVTHLDALTETGEVWDFLEARGVAFTKGEPPPPSSEPRNVAVGSDDIVSRLRIPLPNVAA